MSWFRIVKTLHTAAFGIFYFILWLIGSNKLLGIEGDYRILLLSLGAVFLMQFLGSKGTLKTIIFGVPMAAAVLALRLLQGSPRYMMNFVFTAAFMLFMSRVDSQSIDYRTIKNEVKNSIYALIGVGFILIWVSPEMVSRILRLYMLFLVMAVWLLREARGFSYNLKGKASFAVNAGVMSLVLLLTSDSVFRFVLMILKAVWVRVDALLQWILEAFALFIAVPLIEQIRKRLYELFLRRSGREADINRDNPLLKELYEQYGKVDSQLPPILVLVIKLGILAVIIYMAYKIIKKYKPAPRTAGSEMEEKREKIDRRAVKSGRGPLLTVMHFLRERDFRSQVLRAYQGFERSAHKKDIYRKHMTATQLYNVSSTVVENSEPVRDITEIYNEAKFSSHEVSEEAVRRAKENYRSIKKQM